jgi:hypothetical protein
MKIKSIPLIIIIIVLILFGTAATCNMCGINYTTDTTAYGTSDNKESDTSSEKTDKETAAETTDKETAAPTTEEETAAPTTEAQAAGSSPVIKLIKVTDTGSGTVYDALSTDIPKEWMNQLPVSLELFFHLELSDPDNDKMFCNLSDSKGNNYEPVPVNAEGYADFYWTTPAEPGSLIMRFVITDEGGMETVKELSFTFIQY